MYGFATSRRCRFETFETMIGMKCYYVTYAPRSRDWDGLRPLSYHGLFREAILSWDTGDASHIRAWWRHETFSSLLALCEGNGGFPHKMVSHTYLWCFLCWWLQEAVKQTVALLVVCGTVTLIWCHCYGWVAMRLSHWSGPTFGQRGGLMIYQWAQI